MPRVRPWKECVQQMMRVRFGSPLWKWKRRATLVEPSSASTPELQKNTVSAKEFATSRSASRSCSEIGRDTSELQTLMRTSYADFGLKKKKHKSPHPSPQQTKCRQ